MRSAVATAPCFEELPLPRLELVLRVCGLLQRAPAPWLEKLSLPKLERVACELLQRALAASRPAVHGSSGDS